jgi:hypothetical protein
MRTRRELLRQLYKATLMSENKVFDLKYTSHSEYVITYTWLRPNEAVDVDGMNKLGVMAIYPKQLYIIEEENSSGDMWGKLMISGTIESSDDPQLIGEQWYEELSNVHELSDITLLRYYEENINHNT